MAFTIVGTGGSDTAPTGLAIVLNLKPTRGTGRGQGRKYIGPVATGLLQGNGTVNESFRDAVRNAANDSIVQSAPGDGAFVLYTPPNGRRRDIVSVSVPNKFGMLKSRRD